MTVVNFLESEKKIKGKKHFHVMSKPIGPICNLDCTYCYYLEKENIYDEKKGTPSKFRMDEKTLEIFIRKYIEEQPKEAGKVLFTWHGGEPTLMGLDYFKTIASLQKKYAGGRQIENSLQTNGVTINDEWARFFAEENWLVGLSIDGPQEFHDAYRPNKGGKGTFDQVMRAVKLFQKHGTPYNTLTVVNDRNVRHPKRVYEFLKNVGSTFMQFLPVQEIMAVAPDAPLQLVHPDYKHESRVTKESVDPEAFGDFLIGVFNEWVQRDVGSVFVQHFDVALEAWCGFRPSLCIFAPTCGDALAMEHNGDVYSCDHYVYPEYKIGNILEEDFQDFIKSVKQERFGLDKEQSLPLQCRDCKYLMACNGECPKHRFGTSRDGEKIAYLCKGYYKYFQHIEPYMEVMAKLLHMERPPAEIMGMIAEQKRQEKALRKQEKKAKKKSRR
ncbi:MAG: anaerobic sulfatase-maturation protein [Cytophagales bacterium]|nr:anaerobic sulfatase-maturation protein [Cytophagales bacterium]